MRGAGILDAGTRKRKINMLVLRECRDAVIENIILLDPLGWTMHLSASENVRVSNTRVIGWRANSDGLDIEHSGKVRVDGCFWRTNDDCIAIKAIYPPGVQGVPFEEMINPETLGGHDVPRIEGAVMEDIEIRNCVLWNDSGGQGFEIGFELRIDDIRGITFRDSDIIHVMGGGAFTIHNGDRARIENLLIENIRVEDTDRLVDFHVGLSIYSHRLPAGVPPQQPATQGTARGTPPEKSQQPLPVVRPGGGGSPAFRKQPWAGARCCLPECESRHRPAHGIHPPRLQRNARHLGRDVSKPHHRRAPHPLGRRGGSVSWSTRGMSGSCRDQSSQNLKPGLIMSAAGDAPPHEGLGSTLSGGRHAVGSRRCRAAADGNDRTPRRELWGGGPVLVPGCGSGHDVRAIAETGVPAIGLDIAETAVAKARAIPCDGPASYEHGDFLDPAWRAGRSFPAIWEHTCFCAIFPQQRGAYAEAAAALLPEGGILAGVFYLTPL